MCNKEQAVEYAIKLIIEGKPQTQAAKMASKAFPCTTADSIKWALRQRKDFKEIQQKQIEM